MFLYASALCAPNDGIMELMDGIKERGNLSWSGARVSAQYLSPATQVAGTKNGIS